MFPSLTFLNAKKAETPIADAIETILQDILDISTFYFIIFTIFIQIKPLIFKCYMLNDMQFTPERF